MVINKGLGHADGLGTATVGGKEAIKHRKDRKEIKLFESLKSTEKKKKLLVRKGK